MNHDSGTFVPATMVIGLTVVWWVFRRRLAVALALLSTWTTVATTMGFVALWGRPYTLASAMLPALEAALCMALLIHLFTALSHASRRGYRGVQRVQKALEHVRRPARYTTLTTVAGLLSLAVSPVQSIQTFGVAAAVGAAAAYPVVIAWCRRSWCAGIASAGRRRARPPTWWRLSCAARRGSPSAGPSGCCPSRSSPWASRPPSSRE